MSRLAASRSGTFAGAACSLAVAIWLGPELLDGGPGPDPIGVTRTGIAGLWVAQALALAVLGPRCVGSSLRDRLAGLWMLLAVPMPLLCVAWLATALPTTALARGLLAMALLAGAVAGLATLLERVLWSVQSRRIIAAAQEIGLAALVWASRDRWMSWIEM